MSSRANLLTATLLLLLTACGFQPLYGDKAASQRATVSTTLAAIQIESIPERAGQYLRNALMDRFYKTGRPTDPQYILRVTPVRETLTDLDITKSSSATRAQLRLDTSFVLVAADGKTPVMTRQLVAITSYNILQSRFTTRVSEDAARQAALDDLAGQIERHIALHLARPQ